VTYNTNPTREKETAMTSFEETLFNAMLPMFERALKAVNDTGTPPAAAKAPAASAPLLASRSTDVPKAA
jgi:hypothetical protein